MSDISKIFLSSSGTSYDIKDSSAREQIENIRNNIGNSVYFLGETPTIITDNSQISTIVINGQSITPSSGAIVVYNGTIFIYLQVDNKWHSLNSLEELKNLAFKDTASSYYIPAGTVSQPTFTGETETIAFTGQLSGNVSTPIVTVTPTTTRINSISSVGTSPNLEVSISEETLILDWSQGTLPSKTDNILVVTGIESVESSDITFTGQEFSVEGEYTPRGNISRPVFIGTPSTITVS